ncbi:ZIP family metal transporter [Novosphingobium sp. 9]|uniref:ZIP family metal transporter n=1 Tax=Novosphingobium sp. 9 TaxID=2025349 RepID=UPI0021B655FD|nr:ZIP family metal transporter [Novosphingobium sp. 9]
MTVPLPYLLALGAGLATLAGGLLAMRLQAQRQIVAALTGGFVVGLALFDLLPEAMGHASFAPAIVLAIGAVGFALYALAHRLPATRQLGTATLLIHSLMDGLGIGLAFHLDHATGWLVAAAVLAHDMADGANIVALVSERTRRRTALLVLGADALAPLLGVGIAQMLRVDHSEFALALALFAGGFLYLGLCELVPRGLTGRFTRWQGLSASVTGIAVMACVIRFAH